MPKYRLKFGNKKLIIETKECFSKKKLTNIAKSHCKKKYGVIVENFLMSGDDNEIIFHLQMNGEEQMIYVDDYNGYEDLLNSVFGLYGDEESNIIVAEIENGPKWLHDMITTSGTHLLRPELFDMAKIWMSLDDEDKQVVDGYIELNGFDESSETMRDILLQAENMFVADINSIHGNSIGEKFKNWVMEQVGDDSDEYGNWIPRDWDSVIRDYDMQFDVASNGMVFHRH